MMSVFDISRFASPQAKHSRYERLLERVRSKGIVTTCIEDAVRDSMNNIAQGVRAFVIYGEPQSGKTQMMIALTARLLDSGFRVIVVLLNDNVELLNQNLNRFRASGLDPAARNFAEILDDNIEIGDNEWVVFCKKNSKDLTKLISKLDRVERKVVIDDEADYATPNAKINQGEKTKINALVEKLIGLTGCYIGVTATPARLDLNNTFNNESEKWVDFKPHQVYTGQLQFFPLSLQRKEFSLRLLPDTGDIPKYLKEALLRYFATVAFLNLEINAEEKCYSILIHTSGTKADHDQDFATIQKAFSVLRSRTHKDFPRYVALLWQCAEQMFPGYEDRLVDYVLENINRNVIVVMNSDVDKKAVDYRSATEPQTLFTVVIGGNIVSRGVTFNCLLSMFFTRDTKHKIQQDTYIQRARMFGDRGTYLRYFELTIPSQLYLDWHRCFVFHRLSVESIRAGNGAPCWIEDKRISAVAASSIDRSVVDFQSGEMSFAKFPYSEEIDRLVSNDSISLSIVIDSLQRLLPPAAAPQFLIDFVARFSDGTRSTIAIHPTGDITRYQDANVQDIRRAKGLLGKSQLSTSSSALHHLRIYKNDRDEARLFYKYTGNVKFLQRYASLPLFS